MATIERLLPYIERIPSSARGTLVSLGSGPGSYELWLLAQNYVQHVTLVDISEEMLARAGQIAEQLKLTDRVELICSEVSSVELPDDSFDICLSINSMQWDQEWRTWMKKAIKYTKPTGLLFLSASLLFPQSQIYPDQFVGVAERGMTIHEKEHILRDPHTIVGSQRATDPRYFVVGNKKTAKELKKKK